VAAVSDAYVRARITEAYEQGRAEGRREGAAKVRERVEGALRREGGYVYQRAGSLDVARGVDVEVIQEALDGGDS
jgi:uncharacterized iron-regulated protein